MEVQTKLKTTGQLFSILPFLLAIWLSIGFYVTMNPAAAAAGTTEVSQAFEARHLAPLLKFEIIGKYPHDPEAFTQGLLFHDGYLFESTGLNGSSSLRKVELKTGRVLKEFDLPSQYFGEGLALWGDSLIQLTWKSGTAFQYDLHTFKQERQFRYRGEGWGLAEDKKCLIMSNGSPELSFIDPATFAVERSVLVLDGGRPVQLLNELEYIKGRIFANVWHDDYIAVISPKTGQVTGWLDFSALRGQLPTSAEDLNGIAYDAKKDRVFITGKLWPVLFEIKVSGR